MCDEFDRGRARTRIKPISIHQIFRYRPNPLPSTRKIHLPKPSPNLPPFLPTPPPNLHNPFIPISFPPTPRTMHPHPRSSSLTLPYPNPLPTNQTPQKRRRNLYFPRLIPHIRRPRFPHAEQLRGEEGSVCADAYAGSH